MLIYRISNLQTGRRYIGATLYPTVDQRWRQHLSEARCGRSGPLYEDIRALGPEEFGLTLLGYHRSKKALREAEKAAIQKYEAFGPKGYNTTLGGEGIPYRRRKRREPTPAASE